MSDQKKGILPPAAIVPALLAMHKAVTGCEPTAKDFFSFNLEIDRFNGERITAKEIIQINPEMIQVANVIFMQYSQMAKMMMKG